MREYVLSSKWRLVNKLASMNLAHVANDRVAGGSYVTVLARHATVSLELSSRSSQPAASVIQQNTSSESRIHYDERLLGHTLNKPVNLEQIS